ncbi:conserved hypothetical protein [Hyella patelloides LEGE 07179]|uniref:ATP-grasp domain-containing protein n=1 Tax=Hyella patelloides LEGE 07179 TaxID=945734 RepID=A0A563VNY3_9CYAN|nr:STM4014 family protein [Hyella patelloides]VEP13182.1 conserved hypothetical protein [Hyella patelloides LEGE 07179]
MPLNFIVIANPENRRVSFLQQALEHFNLPAAKIITYADLIAGKAKLDCFNYPNHIIRFDSPERNFETEKAVLAMGADIAGSHRRISKEDLVNLEFDKGRIRYPRQWYLGWKHLLQQWEKQIQCRVMNSPADIITMFDKPASHQLFVNNNIPVARSLGIINSYEQLKEAMSAQNCSRVFVKLANGSSASGVMAYQIYPRGESAITTVERVREDGETLLYNSRRIRNYTKSEEIADIINILSLESVQVEEWLPKARINNRPFDLRVVVIAGEAQHLVMRIGKSPMTNLHLGSDRDNYDTFISIVGQSNWLKMKHTCEAAAAVFPNSLYCGIDLLVYPDLQRHSIIEINAFGDLIPGTTYQGMDTYTSEVKAMLRRMNEEL